MRKGFEYTPEQMPITAGLTGGADRRYLINQMEHGLSGLELWTLCPEPRTQPLHHIDTHLDKCTLSIYRVCMYVYNMYLYSI